VTVSGDSLGDFILSGVSAKLCPLFVCSGSDPDANIGEPCSGGGDTGNLQVDHFDLTQCLSGGGAKWTKMPLDEQLALVPVACRDSHACFTFSSAESCSSDAICDVNNVCEGSTSDTEGTLQGGEGRGAVSVGGCVTPGRDCTSLRFKFNPVVMMDIPARVFVKVHTCLVTLLSVGTPCCLHRVSRVCSRAAARAALSSLLAGSSPFPGGRLPQSEAPTLIPSQTVRGFTRVWGTRSLFRVSSCIRSHDLTTRSRGQYHPSLSI
jgi:hypothetical protein